MKTILFFLLATTAQAETYSCKVGANAGVYSLEFTLDKKMSATEVVYTFNSGIQSQPTPCRVQRLGDSSALFCRGPVRLKDGLFTSILIQKEEISIRFYDAEHAGLPDYGPGGPTEACEIK